MPDAGDVALEAINVARNIVSTSESGITYKSDQITYPADLSSVPDDAVSKTQIVLGVAKAGYLFHSDSIVFTVKGDFRAYDQTIIDDPNSVITPVMANVYIQLESVEKAGSTTLDVQFSALAKPYGTPEDPRIRFAVEGHYDPAGVGDTLFSAVVEIDQQANVTVIEKQIKGGDGEITDNSPAGFGVGIPD